VSRDRLCYSVIDASRNIEAFVSWIVECWRGERQDLNIQPAFVHEGETSVGEI
jgi:hypothetical protein